MQPRLALAETSIRVYGKEFTFPPKGHPDHYKARDEAHRKATTYGEQLLKTMEAQKGGKLTTREQVTGQLDRSPAERTIEHNRPIERHPDVSPYSQRLAELQRQRPMLTADRSSVNRKIDKLQQLEDAWQANRQADRVIEARNADEKIQLMRQHAEHAYQYARLNEQSRPEEVALRQDLLEYANSDVSDPAGYWSASDAADRQLWARLDQTAAEKKAAVDAAKAEATEARQVARDARKVDYAEPLGEQQPATETPAA